MTFGTALDVVLLGFLALCALAGLRRGLLVTVVAAVGFVGGAALALWLLPDRIAELVTGGSPLLRPDVYKRQSQRTDVAVVQGREESRPSHHVVVHGPTLPQMCPRSRESRSVDRQRRRVPFRGPVPGCRAGRLTPVGAGPYAGACGETSAAGGRRQVGHLSLIHI